MCGEKRHLAPGSTSSNRNSKKGNPTAVPALALPDGSVLADSWSIASHASGGSVGLSFDDPRRQFLDSQFGPDTRQLCYAWLLKPENTNVWNALATNSRFGSFWKTLWSWGLGSKVSSRLVSLFKTDDAEEVLNVSRRITGHFEQMSSRLRARPGLAKALRAFFRIFSISNCCRAVLSCVTLDCTQENTSMEMSFRLKI